jgi:hypothetical protein
MQYERSRNVNKVIYTSLIGQIRQESDVEVTLGGWVWRAVRSLAGAGVEQYLFCGRTSLPSSFRATRIAKVNLCLVGPEITRKWDLVISTAIVVAHAETQRS